MNTVLSLVSHEIKLAIFPIVLSAISGSPDILKSFFEFQGLTRTSKLFEWGINKVTPNEKRAWKMLGSAAATAALYKIALDQLGRPLNFAFKFNLTHMTILTVDELIAPIAADILGNSNPTVNTLERMALIGTVLKMTGDQMGYPVDNAFYVALAIATLIKVAPANNQTKL